MNDEMQRTKAKPGVDVNTTKCRFCLTSLSSEEVKAAKERELKVLAAVKTEKELAEKARQRGEARYSVCERSTAALQKFIKARKWLHHQDDLDEDLRDAILCTIGSVFSEVNDIKREMERLKANKQATP